MPCAGPYRRWYQAAAVALTVAATAASIGLLRSVEPPPTPIASLLLAFAAARVLICFFPTGLERQSRTQTGRVPLVLSVAAFAAVATAGVLLGGTVQHLADWTATRGLFGIAGWPLLVTVLLVAAALAIRPLRAAFGALERLFYAAMIAWFLLLGV